jgi:predicted DNA-binding transcriptional regulator AlpA
MDANKINRLLRLAEVSELTSLGKSTINLWVAQGRFPAPTALSSTIKVWRQSDVESWISDVFSTESSRGSDKKYPAENVYTLRNHTGT